jgi:hypothetical protein
MGDVCCAHGKVRISERVRSEKCELRSEEEEKGEEELSILTSVRELGSEWTSCLV